MHNITFSMICYAKVGIALKKYLHHGWLYLDVQCTMGFIYAIKWHAMSPSFPLKVFHDASHLGAVT
jgi:hypothetical protein